jgi:hypothetical protein
LGYILATVEQPEVADERTGGWGVHCAREQTLQFGARVVVAVECVDYTNIFLEALEALEARIFF